MEGIAKQIESVFEALKELEMKMTPKNASIMTAVYQILKDVYSKLNKEEETNDDGSAADSCG